MKDLIRSPLQFVRPMSDNEWQELVARARHGERQRIKRRLPRRKLAAIDVAARQRGLERALRRPVSSASF